MGFKYVSKIKSSALLISLLLGYSSANAARLDGVDVEIPDTIQVKDSASAKDHTLVLNGAGIRKATFLQIKVYVGGLYVEKPSNDSTTLLNSNQLKRMTMNFLHEVPAKKMAHAWEESFEKNCKKDCDKIKPALEELKASFLDMSPGDKVSLTLFPSHVEVAMKNQPVKTIQGADFSKLVLMSWLGDAPPTEELKEGLLGKKKGS